MMLKTIPTSTLERSIGYAMDQFGAVLTQMVGDATAIFRTVYGINDGQDYGRYFAGQNPLVPYITAATSVSEMLAQGVAQRATAELAINTAIGLASGNPVDFANAVFDAVEALRAACAAPADAVRLLTELAAFELGGATVSKVTGGVPILDDAGNPILSDSGRPILTDPAPTTVAPPSYAVWPGPIDATGIMIENLVAASTALMRRAAAVSLARATATYIPTSQQDASAIRDQAADAIDAVALEAADRYEDASSEALDSLRVATIEDLNTRGGSLAPIVTRTFGASQPALVLAYRLYQNSTRASDLLARNDPPHPSFMPVTIEALAA